MTIRIESYAPEFLARVDQQFWGSLNDVLREAQRLSGSGRIGASGRVVRDGHLEGRVIFTHVASKARERGAYIRPRNRRVLKLPNGDFTMHARLRPHPYIKPAGQNWGRTHLPRRMREIR